MPAINAKSFRINFQGPDGDGSVSELNMKNVGGIFAVLAGGCFVALLQGLFRWIYNIKKMSKAFGVKSINFITISLLFNSKLFRCHFWKFSRKSSDSSDDLART